MPDIESLAGVFHPHAIEIQDFSYYALVIDVRPAAAYEDDHIPGAVRIDAEVIGPASAAIGQQASGLMNRLAEGDRAAGHELFPVLAALVSSVKLNQAILVYCGRGGLDSQPVARALRWRGWTVDVLLGGWINYRRWVQAGVEVLPRLVAFRVMSTALGSEAQGVLQALAAVGHQVLDLEALAGRRKGALGRPVTPPPAQAWFESQLLQALRGLDPRRPVWVADLDRRTGSLLLPGALLDALALAPMARLEAPLPERVNAWLEDEPVWQDSPDQAVAALQTGRPAADREQLTQALEHDTRSLAEFMGRLLKDHVEAVRATAPLGRANALLPLVASSLAPAALTDAVGSWMPPP